MRSCSASCRTGINLQSPSVELLGSTGEDPGCGGGGGLSEPGYNGGCGRGVVSGSRDGSVVGLSLGSRQPLRCPLIIPARKGFAQRAPRLERRLLRCFLIIPARNGFAQRTQRTPRSERRLLSCPLIIPARNGFAQRAQRAQRLERRLLRCSLIIPVGGRVGGGGYRAQ